MTEALHPSRRHKNRYTDILPFDHNRVKLKQGDDYINASYLNSIDGLNTWIATQGPLAGTQADFWQMMWEQESATIVMLTPLEENGRVKCSKYWPSLDENMVFSKNFKGGREGNAEGWKKEIEGKMEIKVENLKEKVSHQVHHSLTSGADCHTDI